MGYLRFMVDAPSGIGKTTIIGTAANDDRLWPGLILDFDHSLAAIDDVIRMVLPEELGRKPPVRGRLDAVWLRDWNHYKQQVEPAILSGKLPYKLIAIDSLSRAAEYCLQGCVQEAIASSRSSGRASSHDPEMPEWRDYDRLGFRIRQMLDSLGGLPVHLFVTCHVREKEESTLLTSVPGRVVMPALTEKVAHDVMSRMDIVAYLSASGGVNTPARRTLSFTTEGRRLAKNRVRGSKLGNSLDEPTLPKILDALPNGNQNQA